MISFEKLFDGVKIQEIQNATIDKFFNHPKFDSNKIEKDDVFFCFEGKNIDGHKFACDAAKKGAKAIVCQHSLNISAMRLLYVAKTILTKRVTNSKLLEFQEQMEKQPQHFLLPTF